MVSGARARPRADAAAYRGLAAAILIKAVEDFHRTRSRRKKDAILLFARSEWCNVLCSVVGISQDTYVRRFEEAGRRLQDIWSEGRQYEYRSRRPLGNAS